MIIEALRRLSKLNTFKNGGVSETFSLDPCDPSSLEKLGMLSPADQIIALKSFDETRKGNQNRPEIIGEALEIHRQGWPS